MAKTPVVTSVLRDLSYIGSSCAYNRFAVLGFDDTCKFVFLLVFTDVVEHGSNEILKR